eukprot:GGOE01022450.1.p1 GENE.GGOE01022450.1~~GGOE01022450.1.p1  ORF type:complete len:340 (+),score=63.65 GGOE01022450.1:59-1021(+)
MAHVLLSKLQSFSDGICRVLDSLVEEDEEEAHEGAGGGLPPAEELEESDTPPKLVGFSRSPPTFLGAQQLCQLRRILPVPAGDSGTWQLLYSSHEHRVGLRALYERVDSRRNLLFVLRTLTDAVLGAFLPDPSGTPDCPAERCAAIFFAFSPGLWHAIVAEPQADVWHPRPTGLGFAGPASPLRLWLDHTLRSGHLSGSWGPMAGGPFEVNDIEVWRVQPPSVGPYPPSGHEHEHGYVMLPYCAVRVPAKPWVGHGALICPSVPLARTASQPSVGRQSRCSSRSLTPLFPCTPSSIADTASTWSHPSDGSDYVLIEHIGA